MTAGTFYSNSLGAPTRLARWEDTASLPGPPAVDHLAVSASACCILRLLGEEVDIITHEPIQRNCFSNLENAFVWSLGN